MTADNRSPTPTSEGVAPEPAASQDRSGAVDIDLVLDLLSDEYACELLSKLDADPQGAHELVEKCEMSRPTVYRRLQRMTEAGIVDSRQSSTATGRQRTEYKLVVDAVDFHVHPDGVTGRVDSDALGR